MIKAKVVNPFKEIEHNGHIYKAGDTYPAEGHVATEKRVQFLTQTHPRYKKIYLSDVVKSEKNKSLHVPKHVGGGWYELSNGDKVQGKDEAMEAESALRGD